MIEWMQLIGGGILLYFGAQWLVGGASALALALRVPQLIVGLTVVAFGTSTPEVVVSVQSASAGHAAVALGNIIGSNIANIGLILGVAALIAPAKVDRSLRSRELPVLVASTLMVPLSLIDGVVGRWDAWALLSCAAAYTGWMIHAARSSAATSRARAEVKVAGAATDAAGGSAPIGAARSAATAVFGLMVLLVGGELFVTGAISAAHLLGMSEQLVGLTIVALGTSLPELVTSAIAAKRGHSDLAIGNVVGSNIFNVFLCLGAASLAGTVAASLSTLVVELAALLVMTAVAAVFMRNDRTISRFEGGVMVALYAAITAIAMMRG